MEAQSSLSMRVILPYRAHGYLCQDHTNHRQFMMWSHPSCDAAISNTSPESERIAASGTERSIPGFKTTAQAINALKNPPAHMPSHKVRSRNAHLTLQD